MTERHKLMAYVLNKEFGYSMTDIAKLMKVSQGTISNAIKDITYKKTIMDLTNELEKAKQEAYRLGYEEPLVIEMREVE